MHSKHTTHEHWKHDFIIISSWLALIDRLALKPWLLKTWYYHGIFFSVYSGSYWLINGLLKRNHGKNNFLWKSDTTWDVYESCMEGNESWRGQRLQIGNYSQCNLQNVMIKHRGFSLCRSRCGHDRSINEMQANRQANVVLI